MLLIIGKNRSSLPLRVEFVKKEAVIAKNGAKSAVGYWLEALKLHVIALLLGYMYSDHESWKQMSVVNLGTHEWLQMPQKWIVVVFVVARSKVSFVFGFSLSRPPLISYKLASQSRFIHIGHLIIHVHPLNV